MAKTPRKQQDCVAQTSRPELVAQPSPRQGLANQRSKIALALLVGMLMVLPASGCKPRREPPLTATAELVIPEPRGSKPSGDDEAPLPPRVLVEPRTPRVPQIQLVGVRECDEFLVKYERCIRESAPPELREAMIRSLELMGRSFSNMLTSSDPGTVARTCQQIDDAAAPSMRSLGCGW